MPTAKTTMLPANNALHQKTLAKAAIRRQQLIRLGVDRDGRFRLPLAIAARLRETVPASMSIFYRAWVVD